MPSISDAGGVAASISFVVSERITGTATFASAVLFMPFAEAVLAVESDAASSLSVTAGTFVPKPQAILEQI